MSTFRLPQIGDTKEQNTPKQRRISTGSMMGRSTKPSPPSASERSTKPASKVRTLKRSMSVPGLSLGSDGGSALHELRLRHGSQNSGSGLGKSFQGSEDQDELRENRRVDLRNRAVKEFRVVSAKVNAFCTRTAASSDRRDSRLIDTVDCLEDGDVAAERLFLNNTVLRRPNKRHCFMPDITQAEAGRSQPRDGDQRCVSPRTVGQRPAENPMLPGDSEEPSQRSYVEEETANEMVGRISRWLEDVERMQRDPCDDLATGVSIIALS
ncbi:uncharacterized protein [Asterias amurensis]|uniref:uncharacterized protein n=1 Tax=Asterias amurensis TaxID=7602 RepID=UPI003AB78FC6